MLSRAIGASCLAAGTAFAASQCSNEQINVSAPSSRTEAPSMPRFAEGEWSKEGGGPFKLRPFTARRAPMIESHGLPSTSLSEDRPFRLMEVDHRCIVPANANIRIITASMDVIHSFALPSLAVKLDATPGRLSQTKMRADYPGLYYGQCSELCGAFHYHMPCVVHAIDK